MRNATSIIAFFSVLGFTCLVIGLVLILRHFPTLAAIVAAFPVAATLFGSFFVVVTRICEPN
jgi:hypothetical protein